MAEGKIRIVLTPWACRKIEEIKRQQDHWRVTNLHHPDAHKPSAWHAGRPYADQAFDAKNNCITVRDYRVLG